MGQGGFSQNAHLPCRHSACHWRAMPPWSFPLPRHARPPPLSLWWIRRAPPVPYLSPPVPWNPNPRPARARRPWPPPPLPCTPSTPAARSQADAATVFVSSSSTSSSSCACREPSNRRNRPVPSPPPAGATGTDSSPSSLPVPRRPRHHPHGEPGHLRDMVSLSLPLCIQFPPRAVVHRRASSPPWSSPAT